MSCYTCLFSCHFERSEKSEFFHDPNNLPDFSQLRWLFSALASRILEMTVAAEKVPFEGAGG
jgi:hypothetical protein